AHGTLHEQARCLTVEEPLTPGVAAIRRSGSQTPLFLMHEVSGWDLYFPLIAAHIDEDVPVYGLRGAAPGEALPNTVEGLAARALDLIRSVQPQGPYRLAGWSFGGLLAYEVALQLLGQDQQLEFVGLLDSYLPSQLDHVLRQPFGRQSEGRQLLQLCRSCWEAERDAGGVDVDAGLRAVATLEPDADALDFSLLLRHCRREGALPRALSVDKDELRHYLRRYASHEHALLNYQVCPAPFPVHLFIAEDGPGAQQGAGCLGWDEVLPAERIVRTVVPGDHLSIVQRDAAAMGQRISSALRRAAGRSAHEDPNAAYHPLMTIQKGRAGQTPVFCLPGAGDSVTRFVELAGSLGDEWPVYGLQPRGVDGLQLPHSSVEAAAAVYLTMLETIQPRGPVHLIGHSFGGWLAFELALRLSEQGRPPASLTLLDSEGPGGSGVLGIEYTAEAVWRQYISGLELLTESRLDLNPEACKTQKQRERALHQAMVKAGFLSRHSPQDALAGSMRTFGTALRTRYEPARPYIFRLGLALVDDPRDDAETNQRIQRLMREQWREWAPQLEVWHGCGNHATMLNAPNVLGLGAWWRGRLQ
uniref:thioesterase domain-containing protein n=1 Tax=Chromobacterium vaccinii TaxID=1108595 RepID=UPI000617CA5D